MNKNRLILFNSIFNKVEDGFCCCILCVEYDLVLKVEPLESEIHHSTPLPVIWNLLASAVDDMCYLVGNYKLLILGCEAVSDEKAILDLDCAYHVFWELHVHLIHLLSHHLLLLVLKLLLLLPLLLLIVPPHLLLLLLRHLLLLFLYIK